MTDHPSHHSQRVSIYHIVPMVVGAFIAAFAISTFFIPNNLIDGGTVGIAMILGRLIGPDLIPLFTIALTAPFIVLAARYLGKAFLYRILIAIISFSSFLFLMPHIINTPFHGDSLEVVVIGGGILGVGIGLIIRMGGCLDGTEILGIIINKQYGFTVGQVIFACNVLIFGIAGLVFRAWHPSLMSLITYIVVVKVLDQVLIGFKETKSVLVISARYKEIEKAVMNQLGLGLTVLYGRGGFSGESRELLYIITERLRLPELKQLIFSIDPQAFLAIESPHEVSSGLHAKQPYSQKQSHWLYQLFNIS